MPFWRGHFLFDPERTLLPQVGKSAAARSADRTVNTPEQKSGL
jgi:hypothetical protein